MSTDWVGYGYAALIASGGAIGYVKAGLCCTRSEVKGYDYWNIFKAQPVHV